MILEEHNPSYKGFYIKLSTTKHPNNRRLADKGMYTHTHPKGQARHWLLAPCAVLKEHHNTNPEPTTPPTGRRLSRQMSLRVAPPTAATGA